MKILIILTLYIIRFEVLLAHDLPSNESNRGEQLAGQTCNSKGFTTTGKRGQWDNRRALNKLRPKCNSHFQEQSTWVVNHQCSVISSFPNSGLNIIENLNSETVDSWLESYMRSYFAVALAGELKKLNPNVQFEDLSCIDVNSENFANRVENFNESGPSPTERLSCNRLYELALLKSSYSGDVPGNLGSHHSRIEHETAFLNDARGSQIYQEILQDIRSTFNGDSDYVRWANQWTRFNPGNISRIVSRVNDLGERRFRELPSTQRRIRELKEQARASGNDAKSNTKLNLFETCPIIKNHLINRRKTDFSNICNDSFNLENLKSRYPHIFDQAMLDMNIIERSAADLSLCRKSFYYNGRNYDYDCDGIPDVSDPSPVNPFSPNNQFNVNNHFGGPTLGTTALYGARLDQRDSRRLTVDFNLRINHTDNRISRDDVINKVKSCGLRFYNLIHRSVNNFQVLNNQINFGDFNFNFNIYVNDGRSQNFTKISYDSSDSSQISSDPSTILRRLRRSRRGSSSKAPMSSSRSSRGSITVSETNTVPLAISLNIWKCFCSDCEDRTVEGIRVSRSSCEEDFSPEQREILRENGVNFRSRADAGNLVLESDCDVFQHEFFHRFGIEDEYRDPISYPYNLVDQCNLMNSNQERILPRQIMQILTPRRGRSCQQF